MSTVLPPLANVIALYSRDPARVAEFTARVEADATLRVFCPAPNWIAACHSLPLSLPDSEQVLGQGYLFAEGRDAVMDSPHSGASQHPVSFARLSTALDHPDPRQLAKIPGDFTFFRFRPDGAVTAVRSCGGLVPVYIWGSAGGLVLSTHATWLAKYAGWRGEPDWLITALWLSGWPVFAMNRSHLEGVKILHKGERFDSSVIPAQAGTQFSSRIQRYWYPPLATELRWPTKKIEQEHQQQFREILIGSLRDNLDPGGNNLLALSGGVDSSSLLALTAGHLNYGVKTFSVIPPKSAKFYQREMGYLNGLWDQYGVEHREIEIRSEVRSGLADQLPPLLFPLFNPTTLALVGPMRAAGIRVSFGGEMADEIVGSWGCTIHDWSRHTPIWRIPFMLNRLPRARRLPWYLFRQQITTRISGRIPAPFPARLDSWVSPDVASQLATLRDTTEQEWIQAQVSAYANPTLWLRLIYLDFQPMQWEICSWLDVRRYSPFCCRDIQALALRCHPMELLGSHSKRLLRQALRQMVPEQYLERRDKGSFGIQEQGPVSHEVDKAQSTLHTVGWSAFLNDRFTPSGQEAGAAYHLGLAACYAVRYISATEATNLAAQVR
jgi:asparagine synthetase B (glutamine-hydrolysing)